MEVALTLGMPLLVTGEPGSGKSVLAASIAWELGLGEVLRFPVKSDTESRDLFYRFDTVGRFHAARTLKEGDLGADPGRFIAFEALGRAILLAKPQRAVRELGVPEYAVGHHGEPRRCVYLHLEFPSFDEDVRNAEGRLSEDRVTVESIVEARLGARYRGGDATSRRIVDAVGFFRFLREQQTGLERRPTLAELLDWLDYLMPQRTKVSEWHALAALRGAGEGQGDDRLRAGIGSLLLKSPADQARIEELLTNWRRRPSSGR